MTVQIFSMAALLMSCAAMSSQDAMITPDDISKLDDSTKTYVYVGDYYYLAMRPGHGVGILNVNIDSVSLTDSNTLCVRGRIAEALYSRAVSSAKVFIGTIETRDGEIINDNAPPSPISYYQIDARHEVAADSSGEFQICGAIIPNSYLIVANKGDLLRLYHVGRLVAKSATGREE